MAGLDRLRPRFGAGRGGVYPPTPSIPTAETGVKRLFSVEDTDLAIGWNGISHTLEGFWVIKSLSLRYVKANRLTDDWSNLDMAYLSMSQGDPQQAVQDAIPANISVNGEIGTWQMLTWRGTHYVEGATIIEGWCCAGPDTVGYSYTLRLVGMAEKLHPGRGL